MLQTCLRVDNALANRKTAESRLQAKACLKYKVSYITTIAGAVAAVKGIEAVKNGNGGEGGVKSLQEYHALIKQGDVRIWETTNAVSANFRITILKSSLENKSQSELFGLASLF